MHGVLDAVEGDVRLGQAEFLALVDVDGAGQGEGEQGGGAGAASAEGEVGRGAEGLGGEVEAGVGAAVAGDRAGDVVVAQHPRGGGADGGVLGQRLVDGGAQPRRLPGAGHEGEVERGVQFVGAQVAGEALGVGEPDLADEHGAVLVGDGPPAPVDVVELVTVDVGVRVAAGHEVRQQGVLGRQRGGVDAHAGHAALEPEAQDVLVLLADGGVRPVEVGLFGCEQVEVPVAVGQSGPGGAAELGLPVVRGEFAVGAAAGAEVEQFPFRAARERRPEPGVLVGDVVGHDVDEGADAQFACLGDELLRLGEGAERGVDHPVVGDVVAAVLHRGQVPGVEPQGVDAEFGEVGEAGPDAREVAGAVAVAVGEAADVHLVDDGGAPPVVVAGGRGGLSHGACLSLGWTGCGVSPWCCPR